MLRIFKPSSFRRKLHKFFNRIKLALFLAIGFTILVIGIKFFLPLYSFARENNLTPGFIFKIAFQKELPIKKNQGRTNVVFLGIDGNTNNLRSNLTDSIIFLSIDGAKNDAMMLSIPRDLWLPSLKAKINSAYHYGEEKQTSAGIILAKSSVSEVVGQPIQYTWVFDFSGFKKMIDKVSGVDIFVESSFDDNKFPISGKENDLCGGDETFACRYESLHFEKGQQHMDGELALKYVRSRGAEGAEGSDFGRSRRQQQVVVALKDKILKSVSWRNLSAIIDLIALSNKVTKTDMNWSEKISFFKFFLGLSENKIRRLILDTGDEKQNRRGYLVNPPLSQYDGAWVLVPRSGDFAEIHKYISCQLEDSSCSIKP